MGGAGNDTINGNDGDDIMDGGSGDDMLTGGNGSDILTGGTGNDVLSGGNGADTYIFNLGDGEDIIDNYDPSNWRNDRIVFGEGIKAEDIGLYRNGYDLVIRNKTTGDKVTVKNAMSDGDGWYYIGSVEFADGTKWDGEYLRENTRHYVGTDRDDVMNGQGWGYNYDQNETFMGGAGNDTINGNDGDDELYGEAGNDILSGGTGNDILVGGTGNDTLQGGRGDDTYVFNLGDGEDTIVEGGGTDRIVFGEGILAEDIFVTRQAGDLYLTNRKSKDRIKVKDFFNDDWYKVESFHTSDGRTLDYSKINIMIQAMASFEDSTGMMWEDAVEQKNEQAQDLINQWWVKEAI